MSATEIAMAVLEAEPCRTILGGIAGSHAGRRALSRLSAPYGVFDSFQEAWKAARKARGAGHEHPDDVTIHLNLARSLRPSDYAVLYWISRIGAGDLKLFDFGGNAGNLYYSYSPFLREQFQNIEWTVFDLPPILDQGRKLCAERGISQLRFVSSPRDAGALAILLVSGAFHYWEKSVQEFLAQFPEPPDHILINRTPIHDEQPSFITVQCTPSYAVPCLVRNGRELAEEFAAAGYEMIDRWSSLELRLRLPLFPKLSVPHYSGFYFRREKLTHAPLPERLQR
jgi:putative methyltransferase (TIGR04325 family)